MMEPLSRNQENAIDFTLDRPLVEALRANFAYDPVTGVVRYAAPRRRIRVGDVAGTRNDKGYLQVCFRYRSHPLHKVIWAIMTGEWLPHFVQIDHENGIRDDNRWINLRKVVQRGNSKNAAIMSTNTSGVTGVLWLKRERLWRAEIKIAGQRIELGYFKEKADAIEARKAGERRYHFHQNHGTRHARYPKRPHTP
jgi:hypothetical protein